ncbi:hypothetical protein [Dyadobacter sp. CY326]|uniref:hypothetical protein n=1 Tax=Dyadobacter sp. CY326 TaxID=2907300 RepID=UPI001F209F0C|nr:hypothetical protein [Dyadobacter sp. CY326]MCE7068556.1 hypothetical protein [Dyadobacter sp. CY326]
MLEQLQSLIRENSQQAVVENPEIPNEHNEDVMHTLRESITGDLQNEAQSGNVNGISGLLSGSQGLSGGSLMNNPIVASMATNAIGALMRKFGLSNQAAGGVVGSVLPGVLGGLIGKVNNPNDSSLDLGSVLGGLLGNKSSSATQSTEAPKEGLDIGGMLGGLFGNK